MLDPKAGAACTAETGPPAVRTAASPAKQTVRTDMVVLLRLSSSAQRVACLSFNAPGQERFRVAHLVSEDDRADCPSASRALSQRGTDSGQTAEEIFETCSSGTCSTRGLTSP